MQDEYSDHNAYNQQVQDMQRFCIAAGLEHRTRPEYRSDGGLNAIFEVYYDDWREVGREHNAMTPECTRLYRGSVDAAIRAEVGRDVIK